MATIDFLLLANHAEVQNGLLYASGAGWSDLSRQPDQEGRFPLNHFGIGVGILVPWDETNQPHRFVIRVEAEETETALSAVETEINVGRPPSLPPGTDQPVVFGLGIDIVFPAQGNYRVVAELDEDTRSVRFRVHDQPRP